ncbi:MAG: lysyl oxidase family protein [Streptosporangiaceae bacterium]
MNNSRRALRSAAVAVAGLATAAGLPAGLASAQAAAAHSGPELKLVVAQRSVNVPRYGKRVYIDPGVYFTAVGSALQFDVARAGYGKPITINQVTRSHGRVVVRPVPRKMLEGWRGLRSFMRVTVRNPGGKLVASHVGAFCPDTYNAERSGPNAPSGSPFPQQCASDPFQLGSVWGLQRGWGVDAAFVAAKLPLGKYTVTVNVTTMWQRFLHMTARGSTASVRIKVVNGSRCGYPCPARHDRRHPARSGVLPELPANVPTLANPPASSLPDLVPLPSWGINVNHQGRKNTPGKDVLTFGATVWIGGHSRLDVQGFRSHGSPVMKAYQYFWKNGRVIGRARAGTMGFDKNPGHTHWHFEQFAQYRLLNASKSLVVRSQKVGFCIAPTDGVNLLIPHALWVPTFTGFGGACGSPDALWVQEELPLGWGDTYQQFLAGQAFDVSNLPNGTYYIEVIANPEKVLHESNMKNDVSLRKIILGGTPGNRTVKVPAYHGIDPEHVQG